uniref:TMEM9 family protein n=1 Tax=Hirondellea gigas TaxID=1518452 RepID=A0A6A7FW17_9CRUS
MRTIVFFILPLLLIFYISSVQPVQAQYEDKRCICVCPEPSVVNATKSNRRIYKHSVAPNKCDCDNVVLPNLHEDIKGREKEFCPRCDCKYESRNTTTIKVVVILVTWVISLLVLYMGFLLCLDPLLNKRRGAHTAHYQHQTNEDDLPVDAEPGSTSGPPHALRVRPHNVLGRVTHQQDKWKKQVQQQRRNIYDNHTMLN